MEKSIRVWAPATVANVSCGFDVLGFALKAPADEIIIKRRRRDGVILKNNTPYKLPLKANNNCAGAGVLSLLKHLDRKNEGFEISINQKIRPGSGIGSSAASAVASVVGVNELLGNPLTKEQLLIHCLQGEKVASRAIHADNVAPSLFGGMLLVRNCHPPDLVKLPVPRQLYCVLLHPNYRVNTKEARAILPNKVALNVAKQQWANVGAFVAALYQEDYGLLSRACEDLVVEPFRKSLIKQYDELKEKALIAGALCFNIAGSGPSVFALANSESIAIKVGEEMGKVMHNMRMQYNLYVAQINNEGAFPESHLEPLYQLKSN